MNTSEPSRTLARRRKDQSTHFGQISLPDRGSWRLSAPMRVNRLRIGLFAESQEIEARRCDAIEQKEAEEMAKCTFEPQKLARSFIPTRNIYADGEGKAPALPTPTPGPRALAEDTPATRSGKQGSGVLPVAHTGPTTPQRKVEAQEAHDAAIAMIDAARSAFDSPGTAEKSEHSRL